MDANTGKIHFHYITDLFYFPNRSDLKQFILTLFKREGYKVKVIDYVFCSDEYLLELNIRHLNHDTYTDIITFDLSEDKFIKSEIYISIDRVKENALKFQTSFSRELHRVIFHGALHLCGYKDKSDKDSKKMRSMEELYLSKYFVPRGTQNK